MMETKRTIVNIIGRKVPKMLRCNFCFEKKDLVELQFIRNDGNGNVFHVCKDCLEQIKNEIGAIGATTWEEKK